MKIKIAKVKIMKVKIMKVKSMKVKTGKFKSVSKKTPLLQHAQTKEGAVELQNTGSRKHASI